MLEALPLILQGFQAAITAAPEVAALVVKAKDYITTLFEAGLISKAVQDQCHAHVDAICEAVLAGRIPPELTIEPDPV
jgi:hypothetical protein